ncbi:MAG: hypothetical protein R2783_02340 [Gelidibacter sp.]
MAKKFVEGKRLLYLHPAQTYLFISVVFFFLFSFVSRQQAEELNTNLNKAFNREIIFEDSIQKRLDDSLERIKIRKALKKNQFITGMNDQQIDSILKNEDLRDRELSFGMNEEKIDSLIKMNADDDIIYEAMGMDKDASAFERSLYKQFLKYYKKRSFGDILKAFYDTIPIAMFILLPIFALILKLFFYKRGRFAHHLVFGFYYFAFLFSVFSIMLMVNFVVDIPDWIDAIIILSTFIYLVIAVRRFYGISRIVSILKTSLITFIYMSFVIPIAAGLIAVFAFFSY